MKNIEIDEKAEAEVGKLEIGEKLGFMNWMKSSHGLQVNDDRAFDEEVDAIADIEPDTSVEHRDWHLYLDEEPAQPQLLCKAGLISALQQAGSERRVNLYGSIDGFVADDLDSGP